MIWGGAGSDSLRGSDGVDQIFGGDGDGAICGENDDDQMHGDAGSDTAAIGVAELDGDAEPEILIDGLRDDGVMLVAFQHDLSPLWESRLLTGGAGAPFVVADLDNDGQHEVVVHVWDTLLIVSAEGDLLASAPAPSNGSRVDAPVVADIDGDGLVKILLGGSDWPLVVYSNSQVGTRVSQ